VRDFAIAALQTSSKAQLINIKGQLVARLELEVRMKDDADDVALTTLHHVQATNTDLARALKLLTEKSFLGGGACILSEIGGGKGVKGGGEGGRGEEREALELLGQEVDVLRREAGVVQCVAVWCSVV